MKGVQREEILIDASTMNGGDPLGAGIEELGRISCTYKLEIESLEDIIYEENRELEKCYFDPFVKDSAQITKVRRNYTIKLIEFEISRKFLSKKRR
jgi:hypothetical protein